MKTIEITNKPYKVIVEELDKSCILHTVVALPFKEDNDKYHVTRLQFAYLGSSDQIISNFYDYIDKQIINIYRNTTFKSISDKSTKEYFIPLYDSLESLNANLDDHMRVVPKEYLNSLVVGVV